MSMVIDISAINDEDILRRMWQDTDDFCRKKEIRAHMYKLRETRLRDFYSGDMDIGIGLTKTPLGGSHGDSLADQSFQSFKAKEIRDSESPIRDLKYGVPANIGGWNVMTSSELSADGKMHSTHSLATTEGRHNLPDGHKTFSGKNEKQSNVGYDGDDKNFTLTSGEKQRTHLEESKIQGDDNHRIMENKTSTVVSSSSVKKSQYTSDDSNMSIKDYPYDPNQFQNIENDNFYTSNVDRNEKIETKNLIQSEILVGNNNLRSAPVNSNINEQLISRTIEYPDRNTKVIKEVKSLPDGSTVTTTKYETRRANSETWSSNSNQKSSSTSRHIKENYDNADRIEYIVKDDFSSNKKHNFPIDEDQHRVNKTIRSSTIKETRNKNEVYDNYNDDEVYEISSRRSSKTPNERVPDPKHYSRNTVPDNNNYIPDQNEYHHEIQSNYDEQESREQHVTRTVRNRYDEDDYEQINDRQNVNNQPRYKQDNKMPYDEEINPDTYVKTVKKDLSHDTEKLTSKVNDKIYEKRIEDQYQQNRTKRIENEYSRKRISVDVDKTHEAFARSLRCISPTDSIRSHRSTTSLRNSSSPDKFSRSGRSNSRETDISNKQYDSRSPNARHPETKKSPSKSPAKSTTPIKNTMMTQKTIKTEKIIHINEHELSGDDDNNDVPDRSKKSPKRQPKVSSDDISPTRTVISNKKRNDNRSSKTPDRQPKLSDELSPTRKVLSKTPTDVSPTRIMKPERLNKSPERQDSTRKHSSKTPSDVSPTRNVNRKPAQSNKSPERQPKVSADQSPTRKTPSDVSRKPDQSNKSPERQPRLSGDFSPTRKVPSKTPSDVSPTRKVPTKQNKSTPATKNDITKVEKIITTERTTIEDKDSYPGNNDRYYPKKPTDKLPSEINKPVGPRGIKVPVTDLDSDNTKYTPKDETQRPKERPPFVRSETYEERCRKILGMSTDTDEVTVEKVVKKQVNDIIDFIANEKLVENRNQEPKKPQGFKPDRTPNNNVEMTTTTKITETILTTSDDKSKSPTRNIPKTKTTLDNRPQDISERPVENLTNKTKKFIDVETTEIKSNIQRKLTDDFYDIDNTDYTDRSPDRKFRPNDQYPSETNENVISIDKITKDRFVEIPSNSDRSPDQSPTRKNTSNAPNTDTVKLTKITTNTERTIDEDFRNSPRSSKPFDKVKPEDDKSDTPKKKSSIPSSARLDDTEEIINVKTTRITTQRNKTDDYDNESDNADYVKPTRPSERSPDRKIKPNDQYPLETNVNIISSKKITKNRSVEIPTNGSRSPDQSPTRKTTGYYPTSNVPNTETVKSTKITTTTERTIDEDMKNSPRSMKPFDKVKPEEDKSVTPKKISSIPSSIRPDDTEKLINVKTTRITTRRNITDDYDDESENADNVKPLRPSEKSPDRKIKPNDHYPSETNENIVSIKKITKDQTPTNKTTGYYPTSNVPNTEKIKLSKITTTTEQIIDENIKNSPRSSKPFDKVKPEDDKSDTPKKKASIPSNTRLDETEKFINVTTTQITTQRNSTDEKSDTADYVKPTKPSERSPDRKIKPNDQYPSETDENIISIKKITKDPSPTRKTTGYYPNSNAPNTETLKSTKVTTTTERTIDENMRNSPRNTKPFDKVKPEDDKSDTPKKKSSIPSTTGPNVSEKTKKFTDVSTTRITTNIQRKITDDIDDDSDNADYVKPTRPSERSPDRKIKPNNEYPNELSENILSIKNLTKERSRSPVDETIKSSKKTTITQRITEENQKKAPKSTTPFDRDEPKYKNNYSSPVYDKTRDSPIKPLSKTSEKTKKLIDVTTTEVTTNIKKKSTDDIFDDNSDHDDTHYVRRPSEASPDRKLKPKDKYPSGTSETVISIKKITKDRSVDRSPDQSPTRKSTNIYPTSNIPTPRQRSTSPYEDQDIDETYKTTIVTEKKFLLHDRRPSNNKLEPSNDKEPDELKNDQPIKAQFKLPRKFSDNELRDILETINSETISKEEFDVETTNRRTSRIDSKTTLENTTRRPSSTKTSCPEAVEYDETHKRKSPVKEKVTTTTTTVRSHLRKQDKTISSVESSPERKAPTSRINDDKPRKQDRPSVELSPERKTLIGRVKDQKLESSPERKTPRNLQDERKPKTDNKRLPFTETSPQRKAERKPTTSPTRKPADSTPTTRHGTNENIKIKTTQVISDRTPTQTTTTTVTKKVITLTKQIPTDQKPNQRTISPTKKIPKDDVIKSPETRYGNKTKDTDKTTKKLISTYEKVIDSKRKSEKSPERYPEPKSKTLKKPIVRNTNVEEIESEIITASTPRHAEPLKPVTKNNIVKKFTSKFETTPKPKSIEPVFEEKIIKKVNAYCSCEGPCKPSKHITEPKEDEKKPRVKVTDKIDKFTNAIDENKISKKLVTERKSTAPVIPSNKLVDKSKFERSASENIIKRTAHTSNQAPSTVRKPIVEVSEPKEQPRRSSLKSKPRPTKCITTKTINITSTNLTTEDIIDSIIIDIQQAKSSREPSPNKIIPVPVSPEEDTGPSRFPDEILEPEDIHHKKRVIKNIPIFEESTNDTIGCKITEIHDNEDYYDTEDDDKFKLHKVTDDDECLLSVSDKVSRFITLADETTTQVKKSDNFIAIKDSANIITKDIENDDCLLSVSEKVNKFIISAEEISKTKPSSVFKQPDNYTDNVKRFDRPSDSYAEPYEDKPSYTTKEVVTITTNKIINQEIPDNGKDKPVPRSTILKKTEVIDENKKNISRTVKSDFRKTIKEPINIRDDREPVDSYINTSKKDSITNKYQTTKDIETIVRKLDQDKNNKLTKPKHKDDYHDDDDVEDQTFLNKSTIIKTTTTTDSTRSTKPRDTYDQKRSTDDKTTTRFKSTYNDGRVAKDEVHEKFTTIDGKRRTTDITTEFITEESKKQIPNDKYKTSKIEKSGITKNIEKPKPSAPENDDDDHHYYPTAKQPESFFLNQKNIEISTITRKSDTINNSNVSDRYKPEENKRSKFTSSPTPLKSTEVMLKAREIFENKSKETKPKQIDILSRPSVWKHKNEPTPTTTVTDVKLTDIGVHQKSKISPSSETRSDSPDFHKSDEHISTNFGKRDDFVLRSLRDKKTTVVTTKKNIFERKMSDELEEQHYYDERETSQERKTKKNLYDRKVSAGEIVEQHREHSRSTSQDRGRPSYMNHTVSSYEHINRRDSRDHSYSDDHESIDESTVMRDKSMKFGIELKRTNSQNSQARRKSSCSEIPCIEDIFELELLEKMLETVVGYEHRRRIRSQIRLLKKSKDLQSIPSEKTSQKFTDSNKTSNIKRTAQFETTTTNRTPSTPGGTGIKPEISYQYTTKTTKNEEISKPVGKKTITHDDKSKKTIIKTIETTTIDEDDGKPVWMKKNLLKKPSENIKTTTHTIRSSNINDKSNNKKLNKIQSSVDVENLDCVTSSYGIGPTDENGKPLFGIRALKKQTQKLSEDTKESAPENFHEITSYHIETTSNSKKSPQDIRESLFNRENIRNSYRRDSNNDGTTTSSRTTKHITRSFIEKEIDDDDDNVKVDDQSEYTFTTTPQRYTATKETKSFLNSEKNVTGISDVLTRMKNADNVEEENDTEEDKAARSLLNKFLGASILISATESALPDGIKYSQVVTTPKRQVTTTTTTVTKTLKSSLPSTESYNIDEICDETELKKLLEQSKNYEERRQIRARIRQIMAEKEASIEESGSEEEIEIEEIEIIEMEDEKVNEKGSDKNSENNSKENDKAINDKNNNNSNNKTDESGESLLLPLLQGLLHRKTIKDSNNDVKNNPVEDSGIESGEDLKFLAAGIRDSIDNGSNNSNDNSNNRNSSDILLEVTKALEKLQSSLLDVKELNLDMNKRNTLLTLVSRLQTNLLSDNNTETKNNDNDDLGNDIEIDENVNQERRLSSNQGRFAKRRSRQNRHTIGVSREEIADARRLMEDIVLREKSTIKCEPVESTKPDISPKVYNLQKNNSVGTFLSSGTVDSIDEPTKPKTDEPRVFYRPNQFVPRSTFLNKDYSVHTPPVIQMRDRKPKYKFFRQSLSLDQPNYNINSETYNNNNTHKNVQFHKNDTNNNNNNNISSDDEKSPVIINSDIKGNNKYIKNLQNNETKLNAPQKIEKIEPKPYELDESSSSSYVNSILDYSKSSNNKYQNMANKRNKMKRANTIDFAKAHAMMHASDSESEKENIRQTQQFDSGLKGLVQPTVEPVENVVPKFTPKTENDHKFLAFLHKQNTVNTQQWINPNKTGPHSKRGPANWNNTFGNLKNVFENKNNSAFKPPPIGSLNSAKNFWKKESERIQKASGIMFDDHQYNNNSNKSNDKSMQYPWSMGNEIINIKEKERENFARHENNNNNINSADNHNQIVNNFSHAPLSAFKPILRNDEIPVFRPIPPDNFNNQNPNINHNINHYDSNQLQNYNNYQPPQVQMNPKMNNETFHVDNKRGAEGYHNLMTSSQNQHHPPSKSMGISQLGFHSMPSSPSKSPVGIPWASKPHVERRVLSIAASKFEKQQPENRSPHLKNRLTEKRPSVPNCFDYTTDHTANGAMKNFNYTSNNNFNSKNLPSMFVPPQNALKPKLPATVNEPVRGYHQFPTSKLPPSSLMRQSNLPTNNSQMPQFPTSKIPQSVLQQPLNNNTTSVVKQNFAPSKLPSSLIPQSSFPKQTINAQNYPTPNAQQYQNSSNYKPVQQPQQQHYQQQVRSPIAMQDQNLNYSITYNTQNQNRSEPYQISSPSSMELQQYPTYNMQSVKSPVIMSPNKYQQNYSSPSPSQYKYSPQPYDSQNNSYLSVEKQQSNQKQPPNKNFDYGSSPTSQIPMSPKKSSPLPIQETNPQNFPAYTYTSTDYTQSACVSTYIPQLEKSSSLTSPNHEPLILTCNRPIISPTIKENHSTDHSDTTEHGSVTSKIMTGPVSQTAVTVTGKIDRSRQNDDDYGKEMTAKQNLSSVLSQKVTVQNKFDETKNSNKKPVNNPPIVIDAPLSPMIINQNNPPPPSPHAIYNNINKSPTNLPPSPVYSPVSMPQSPSSSPFSKFESWHQNIGKENAPSQKPVFASESRPSTRGGLNRAKSGHSLQIPKQYEAGIKKTEVTEKQKTVAAYFSGQKSPQSLSRNSSQQSLHEMLQKESKTSSSINRHRTKDKISVNKQDSSSGGLMRSQTMPQIGEKKTTQIVKSEKSKETDDGGAITTKTTTTKVTTTRSVAANTKVASPFAKFHQLDKQTSAKSPQNSPQTPSTPKTPGQVSAPLFTFTDPAVGKRVATVKDQLLQWCQIKTKEYENIKIDNFSTSWSDGMAFCALIHHFRPDAFDYKTLTPQKRRYNFELAFRIADEKAGIYPLLDVEDMVTMRKPDWKCVFTYVQSIYRRFKDSD